MNNIWIENFGDHYQILTETSSMVIDEKTFNELKELGVPVGKWKQQDGHQSAGEVELKPSQSHFMTGDKKELKIGKTYKALYLGTAPTLDDATRLVEIIEVNPKNKKIKFKDIQLFNKGMRPATYNVSHRYFYETFSIIEEVENV